MGLGRSALKTKLLIAVSIGGVILSFLGVNELLILLCGGIAVGLWKWIATRKPQGSLFSFLAASPFALLLQTTSAAGAVASFGLGKLFLFFLKVGAVLYGSGYVLLAFIRADLVERWHWLSEAQLLDAIAVGQVTPGPVFTTATFIGYVLSGPAGAFVATVGIFLPAFFFVAVSRPLLPRIRRSATAGAVLDGVNAASLALMVVVTFQLGRSALVDPVTILLAALSAILLLWFRVNSTWLVLGGAIAGMLLYG